MPGAAVSYASTQIGADLLVYGVANTPAITAVEVTAEHGAFMRQMLHEPGWSILLRNAQRLHELRTIAQVPADSAVYRQPAHVGPQ